MERRGGVVGAAGTGDQLGCPAGELGEAHREGVAELKRHRGRARGRDSTEGERDRGWG